MQKTALVMSLFVAPTPALADTAGIVASNNQFGIQHISTNVNYTETGNGIFGTRTGTLDTESGRVPGLALSVSSMKGPAHDYIYAEIDQARGSTRYTGALCTAAGGCGPFGSYVGASTATLTNYSGRFGVGHGFNAEFMATPYVEIGRHQWDRGINYGETYTHFYLGVGVLAQYSPRDEVVLTANAMLGRTVRSYITVNGSPTGGGFSGSLGNSFLPRVGAAADYALTQRVHGTFSVDYVRFSYGMSAVYPAGGGIVAWEPESRTTYVTVKLGLGLSL